MLYLTGKQRKKMDDRMLTLDKFEEASEVVKKVTHETKLVYSDYFSGLRGNKVYLKPENMQFTGVHRPWRTLHHIHPRKVPPQRHTLSYG